MNRKINTRLFTIILAAITLTSVLFMPGSDPLAEAKSKKFGNSEVIYDGERPVHPGYPRLFDIVGKIDRLTADEAVIDDTLYRLSFTVEYHTPNQRHAMQSRFEAGDLVGCLIDSNGEITSMWRIAENER